MPELQARCETLLGSGYIAKHNVVPLLIEAERHNAARLRKLCLDFIRSNYFEVVPPVAVRLMRALVAEGEGRGRVMHVAASERANCDTSPGIRVVYEKPGGACLV